MTIAAFIVALVGPVMARFLSAMGLSLVSMVGVTAAWGALKGMVTSSLAGLPADVIGLGGLFGIWHCVGIIIGTYAFVISWNSTAGFWSLAKK